jgi:nucleoside-diphosphate-sugar epimerase
MKLLVTGICGRLGRAVVSEAVAQGWQVAGIDQAPWPDPAGPPAGVAVYSGTLDDGPLLDRLMQESTHFLHTAGLHGEHLKDFGLTEFLRSNVDTVAELIGRCLKHEIRHICLSSTMEVLVGRDYRASGAAVVDEESPLRTDSAYSISRATMERLAVEMVRHCDVSLTILRYMGFGYKADQRLGLGLLSRHLSARDAGRAALLAVTANGMKGEIFHVGPKSPLTNSDILQAAKDPASVLEKYYPGSAAVVERAGFSLSPEMFWPVTSVEKARRLLGWEPQYTFESWLADYGWERPTSL